MLGSRSRRPFELAAECGADETLREILYAMAEYPDAGQPSGSPARNSPHGRGGSDMGANSARRGKLVAAAVPVVAETESAAHDADLFEAHEAAEMRRLSSAVRMAEARIEGLRQEVEAWKAEATEKEKQFTQGSAAAKKHAQSEVAAAETQVAALRAGAEELAAEVRSITATLDEREEQIEQLEEALEWQEDL